MRPRTLMAIALSLGAIGAAAAAMAQQQQNTFAGARQPAAQQPAAARKAPVTEPSLFDKFASMLKPQAATPAPQADASAPQALPVNWTSAKRYAQAGGTQGGGNRFTSSFVAKNRIAIDSLSVPVLLPSDPDLAIGLRIFPHGDFYTVSSTAHGMSFVMTGHSRAYPLPPRTARGLGAGGLAARIPADGIVIEGNETGLDADFSRFGAVYSIALDCQAKGADPRCGSDAYVRGVIARMAVVTPAGRS